MDQSSFDESCSAGVDAIYESMGVAANYTPAGGTAVSVTVVIDDRSRTSTDKQGSRSNMHVLRGSVRVSEVAELGRGDTLQLGGESIAFKILPSSVSNDGLEWDFEATADVTTTVGSVGIIPNR